MEADWTQPILILASIFGVFLWLRNDIKSQHKETRDDMKQLRSDIEDDMKQLRSDIEDDVKQLRSDIQNEMQQIRSDLQSDIRRVEGKVDGLDSRLRAVESEQSRVAGLLEGLGLAGALPGKES